MFSDTKNSQPPWRLLLILIVVFLGGCLVHYALSGTKEETTILAIATVFIAVANIVLVVVHLVDVAQTRQSVKLTVKSLAYSRQANQRAERVFVAQNIPRIGTTPKAIGPNPKGPGVVTLFSIVNYSGFTAYNIGIDLRYGEERGWIGEWLKANKNTKQQRKGLGEKDSGVNLYLSAPITVIERLDAGRTEERELNLEEEYRGMSGSLNLEEDVCSQKKGG